MSDVVLLRKLTLKSTLNFGKFADLTVQQCIDTKKRKYLRWVYFNCSNITFMDDVLDELKIPVWYRFDKPNKNVELGVKLEENLKETYPEWFNQKLERKANRIKKSKAIGVDFKTERVESKLSLMNKNRRTKSKYN